MRRAKQWTIYIMVLSIVFGMFPGMAFGASTRFALVTEVSGTVKVTKAGGTKEIRVFTGMGLNEGDKLKVEKGSSVTLKLADQDDEIVLGETFNGALSKLKSSSGGNSTAVKTWAGSVYNNVQQRTGSSSSYKVETPTAVMGVRGTHYTVVVDPVTGIIRMYVQSGKVAVTENVESNEKPDAPIVLPAQQIEVYSTTVTDDITVGISYQDLNTLIQTADDEVIAKILLNKEEIDQENQEQLDDLDDQDLNTTLELDEEEQLERYRSNVDNLLFGLLKDAADSGKIADEELVEIIEQANQTIGEEQREYSLDREVPEIDRTAGVDPEKEKQREEDRQETLQKQLETVETKTETRERIIQEDSTFIEEAKQTNQSLQEQNTQVEQVKKVEAEQKHVESLPPAQAQQEQQQIQNRKEEVQNQEIRKDPVTPTTPTTTPPTTPPPPTPGNDSKRSTTTEIQASAASVYQGQSVTFTATVRSGSSTVTSGQVRFMSGTVPLGTVSLNTSGQAVLSKSDFVSGTHTITAEYVGNSTYEKSTSSSAVVTVRPNATVTVSATPPSAAQGETVALKATVKIGTAPLTSGTVSFKAGSTPLGSASLNLQGEATLNVSNLSVGTHTITAEVAQSTTYGAGSGTTSVTITSPSAIATTTTLTRSPLSSNVDVGDPVTFTATVKAGTTPITSGTVIFSTVVGSLTTQIGTASLQSDGTATLSYSGFAVGTHNVIATFQGTSSYASSASSSVSVTIVPASLGFWVQKIAEDSSSITVGVRMNNFTGDKAVYGAQFHFVHPVELEAGLPSGATTYYNSAVLDEETTAENIKDETGTIDGVPTKETVYAISRFGAAEPVDVDGNATIATIRFVKSSAVSGTLTLGYVKIVDENGDVILEIPADSIPSSFSIAIGS